MHRCFQSLDIIKNICIHAYEGGYDPDCRNTVAALNATCRAFHRAASVVLWSRIFSLRPLVQCMPSDVWAEEVVDATDSRSAIVRRSPLINETQTLTSNGERQFLVLQTMRTGIGS